MTNDPKEMMEKDRDADEKLRHNLSMSDDADAVVGSGRIGVNVERAEQIQQQLDKEKERKRKQAQSHIDAILADIRAMEAELTNFENEKFGGLAGLGAKMGVVRKAGETDEEYRKSIRDNIQAQLVAGTLEDPDGDIREWARQYDAIEEKKAHLSQEREVFLTQATPDNAEEIAQDTDKEALMTVDETREQEFILEAREEVLEESIKNEVDTDVTISRSGVDDAALDFLAAFPPVQEEFTLAASGQQQEPSLEAEQAPEAPAVNNSPNMLG